MIEHVYRRAAAAPSVDAAVVATDDSRIAKAIEGFGGIVRMTRSSHRSGTDRLAEVAESLACDIIVNVQGDEPLIEPQAIEDAISPLLTDAALQMSTVCVRIRDAADYQNPNVVKVVVDSDGNALYFSRSPIPHFRTLEPAAGSPISDPRSPIPDPRSPVYKHLGLYAYRRSFLLAFARLQPTRLELAESLEQLRALEHGFKIRTVETQHDSIGVDTPEDLERVRRLLTAEART